MRRPARVAMGGAFSSTGASGGALRLLKFHALATQDAVAASQTFPFGAL